MPPTRLSTPTGLIGGWRADPHDQPRGGIVVVQEIFGLNRHIRSVVERFAAHGFSVIAPAIFDHVERGVELEYDAAGVARGLALTRRIGFDRAIEDVQAAAELLRDRAEHIGVVGYCWGGTVAFLANTRLGLPSVSYYGGKTVPFLRERPRAHMMMHFGAHDPHITPEDVQAHRDALPRALIRVWDAGHGFNCEQRADYDEEAAQGAFRLTRRFFRWVLGS